MSDGPVGKSAFEGLVSNAVRIMENSIEQTMRMRTAALGGMAKEFIERTGCDPQDVTLVEERRGDKVLHYFALKSEVIGEKQG